MRSVAQSPSAPMEPARSSAATASTAARSRVVGLVSPSGHGNLGDEAIIASTIANIRERLPDARFVGITLRPDDSRRRFGIDAFPIAGISRPGYTVRDDRPVDSAAATGAEADAGPQPDEAPRPIAQGRRSTSLVTMLKSAVKRIVPREALWTVLQEVRHLRAANRLVRDAHLVIVAGGGQVDDFWGGPWGQPYALFKWSLLCRVHRKPFLVASVGFCSLDSALSRWFTRHALRLARYRSFRDEGSLQLMQRVDPRRRDPVVPDLAFGLVRDHHEDRAPHDAAARLVCISPMVYLDPVTWPIKDAAGHAAYLDRLARVAAGLLAEGRSVTLVASDYADRRAVAAVRDRLTRFVPPDAIARLSAVETETADAFVRVTAAADVFVGSRLHGLLLALLAGTPVVALSYDRKVEALMQQIGQDEKCPGIGDFEPAAVIARVGAIADEGSLRRSAIAARVDALSRQVRHQFDTLVESPG